MNYEDENGCQYSQEEWAARCARLTPRRTFGDVLRANLAIDPNKSLADYMEKPQESVPEVPAVQVAKQVAQEHATQQIVAPAKPVAILPTNELPAKPASLGQGQAYAVPLKAALEVKGQHTGGSPKKFSNAAERKRAWRASQRSRGFPVT